MKIDYSKSAKEIATEELIEYYKFIKTPYPSQYPKIAIDLAIHQYERLKEVCPKVIKICIESKTGRSAKPFEDLNPKYLKICEVLDYLNRLI